MYMYVDLFNKYDSKLDFHVWCEYIIKTQNLAAPFNPPPHKKDIFVGGGFIGFLFEVITELHLFWWGVVGRLFIYLLFLLCEAKYYITGCNILRLLTVNVSLKVKYQLHSIHLPLPTTTSRRFVSVILALVTSETLRGNKQRRVMPYLSISCAIQGSTTGLTCINMSVCLAFRWHLNFASPLFLITCFTDYMLMSIIKQ